MRTFSLALVGALAVAGCGCGSSGRSGGSGVRGDKSVSDLTAEDATALCNWRDQLVKDNIPTPTEYCEVEPVLASRDKAGCESRKADCLAAPPTESEIRSMYDVDHDCRNQKAPNAGSGCAGITVSALETCVKARHTTPDVSCDDAGTGLGRVVEAACKVAIACPALDSLL